MSSGSPTRNVHVLALVHVVADLPAAEEFLIQTLNLPVSDRGSGWTALDNGSIFLRLIAARPGAGLPSSHLVLEVPTKDVPHTAEALLSQPGVTPLAPASMVAPDREEQWLRAPHGLTLCVARHLDEDERDFTPPLPTCLDWESDAESLLKDLLRLVPVSVRDLARGRSTERAEVLAVERGEVSVARLDAVRGLVQATPTFMRKQLETALVARGLEIEPLRADLDEE